MLPSSVQEMNQKEVSLRNRFQSGLEKGHQGLFLRPDGDFRRDDEFKSDLADKFEEVGGKIDIVFDDRNQVVEMWRQRGTTVVQVADGDF